MTHRMVLLLVVHGLLLALFGMVLGFPLQGAIVGAESERAQLAWRSSHTTLVTGGTFYLAVAAVGPRLVLGSRAGRLGTLAFVLASYCFAAVLGLGPVLGARGLEFAGPPSHVAIHVGFLAAIALLLTGCAVILWGAAVALFARSTL